MLLLQWIDILSPKFVDSFEMIRESSSKKKKPQTLGGSGFALDLVLAVESPHTFVFVLTPLRWFLFKEVKKDTCHVRYCRLNIYFSPSVSRPTEVFRNLA